MNFAWKGAGATKTVCFKVFLLFCSKCTSRISLILQPPFPIREPHWLAGTTMRRVTGGLLVAVLFVIELLMSWARMWEKSGHFRLRRGQQPIICLCSVTNLFQLVNDHGECFKDGSGRTCQSDDPLGAVALRDVDASPALQTWKRTRDWKKNWLGLGKNRQLTE